MKEHDLELISRYVDNEADETERAHVEAHLAECAACRDALDGFRAIGDRVREASPAATPERRALDRILGRPVEPLWRRPIPIPAPAFAALLVVLAAAVVLLVVWRPSGGHVTAPPPAATDLSRYDGGNRLEVYVDRHAPERTR